MRRGCFWLKRTPRRFARRAFYLNGAFSRADNDWLRPSDTGVSDDRDGGDACKLIHGTCFRASDAGTLKSK
ncbi:hypothetical protein BLM15_30700 (plasmid) [Bosea sp. Tri-49]|nr:hypothetical protein BLM15_30700 [Bosea sp. Tri-49]